MFCYFVNAMSQQIIIHIKMNIKTAIILKCGSLPLVIARNKGQHATPIPLNNIIIFSSIRLLYNYSVTLSIIYSLQLPTF